MIRNIEQCQDTYYLYCNLLLESQTTWIKYFPYICLEIGKPKTGELAQALCTRRKDAPWFLWLNYLEDSFPISSTCLPLSLLSLFVPLKNRPSRGRKVSNSTHSSLFTELSSPAGIVNNKLTATWTNAVCYQLLSAHGFPYFCLNSLWGTVCPDTMWGVGNKCIQPHSISPPLPQDGTLCSRKGTGVILYIILSNPFSCHERLPPPRKLTHGPRLPSCLTFGPISDRWSSQVTEVPTDLILIFVARPISIYIVKRGEKIPPVILCVYIPRPGIPSCRSRRDGCYQASASTGLKWKREVLAHNLRRHFLLRVAPVSA